MSYLGRITYLLLLPIIRWRIRRTTRAYVLVTAGGRALLVKGWLGRQNWNLPGGGLKFNEKPEVAAIREVAEETGIVLAADRLRKVKAARWQTDQLGHKYVLFRADLARPVTVKKRWPELIDARWVKLSELDESNCPVEILTIL